MTPTDPSSSHAAVADFDYAGKTRLVFGPNSLRKVGHLAVEMGAKRVLVVTDPGITAVGHADHVMKLLSAVGLEAELFSRVNPNPTTKCVEDCAAMARDSAVDALIGLGGGSSMDTAKGCNFLLTNGGQMKDYWGFGKASKPMLPLIAIPTTAGTGSECQSYALISDVTTHQKMACGDPKAAARIAILDPLLTLSQPLSVTACTGIDAIAHAVETAVTRKRNPLSLMFSHEAFKLCVSSFPIVLANPQDVAARSRMLLGAAFAGTAIESSMLGAAHSAANPLTAHYDIVHGQAVGMLLPAVVRFNGGDPAVRQAYAELASAPEIACASEGAEQAWTALICRLDHLANLAGFPRSFDDCGVPRRDIPMLAAEAAKQWTAQFNPRPVTAAEFEAIYTSAFSPRSDGEA